MKFFSNVQTYSQDYRVFKTNFAIRAVNQMSRDVRNLFKNVLSRFGSLLLLRLLIRSSHYASNISSTFY